MFANIDWTMAGAVVITGLVVVFVVLVLLWFIVELMGKILSGFGKPKNLSQPPVKAVEKDKKPLPIKSEMEIEGGITDEVVAVITAAISAIEGTGNFVLRSIRQSRSGKRSAWASAGIEQNTRLF